MSANRKPNYQTVEVPASFSGSAVFTVPAGAADVTLGAPAGNSSAEIAIRPISIAGTAFDPALAGSEAGPGLWQMRPSGEPTSQAIGFDAQIAGGPLNCLLTWWS